MNRPKNEPQNEAQVDSLIYFLAEAKANSQAQFFMNSNFIERKDLVHE